MGHTVGPDGQLRLRFRGLFDGELQVRLEELPAPDSFLLERHRPGETRPYLRVARIPGGYFLEHADGIALEVLDGGRRVAITRLERSLSQRTIDHLLLDQLLPLVVAHLGRLSFHGSAVAWDDLALCFLANAGTGKSTLAGALVTFAGARFVADDHVVLDGRDEGFVVQPSYPSVRLWDAAAEALFGAPQTDRSKRHFELPTATLPIAVRALVLLARGEASGPAIGVERLTRRDGLVGIADHLDRLDPTDPEVLRREIEQLGRLVERTEIVRLKVTQDLSRLEEIAQSVRRWTRGDC